MGGIASCSGLASDLCERDPSRTGDNYDTLVRAGGSTWIIGASLVARYDFAVDMSDSGEAVLWREMSALAGSGSAKAH
jgi:hypothetical protein